MNPTLCGIVAMDRNRAIGKNNSIPWHIKEDYKFFKETTLGYPVIMGRKTWESLPKRPLPDRKNIVVTRTPELLIDADKVYWATPSVHNAIDTAFFSTDKSFIIGGSVLYETTINRINTLYVTHVDTEIEDADAFFPDIPLPSNYELIKRFESTRADEYSFEIRKYTL